MRKVIITISLLLLTVILGAQEMPLSGYYFYVAVYREDVKWVQKHLEAGYNPNKCRGEAGTELSFCKGRSSRCCKWLFKRKTT